MISINEHEIQLDDQEALLAWADYDAEVIAKGWDQIAQ